MIDENYWETQFPGAHSSEQSKYIDDQGQTGWCWIAAIQGVFRQKFGVYATQSEMFEENFKRRPLSEEDRMQGGSILDRKNLISAMLNKYHKYEYHPYLTNVTIKKDNLENLDSIIKEQFLKIYRKCGSFVCHCYFIDNHAILISDVNSQSNTLTIESWGMRYKISFHDFFITYKKIHTNEWWCNFQLSYIESNRENCAEFLKY